MGITQNRMIALLADAKECRDAYEAILRTVDLWRRDQLRSGGTSSSDLLVLQTELQFIPRPRMAVISVEEYHFRKNANRNVREKERQTQKRLQRRMGINREVAKPGSGTRYEPLPDLNKLVASMAENDPIDEFNEFNPLDVGEPETEDELFTRFQQEGMTEAQARSSIQALKDEGALR